MVLDYKSFTKMLLCMAVMAMSSCSDDDTPMQPIDEPGTVDEWTDQIAKLMWQPGTTWEEATITTTKVTYFDTVKVERVTYKLLESDKEPYLKAVNLENQQQEIARLRYSNGRLYRYYEDAAYNDMVYEDFNNMYEGGSFSFGAPSKEDGEFRIFWTTAAIIGSMPHEFRLADGNVTSGKLMVTNQQNVNRDNVIVIPGIGRMNFAGLLSFNDTQTPGDTNKWVEVLVIELPDGTVLFRHPDYDAIVANGE